MAPVPPPPAAPVPLPDEPDLAVAGHAPGAGEAPVWPGEEDEALFLAGSRTGDEESPALPAGLSAEAPDPGQDLPPLDALVARVPAPLRAALDDLFRAKFTRARRLPASALKPR